ncbi:hypothetical protein ACJX0J_028288, partial [Zea mays]
MDIAMLVYPQARQVALSCCFSNDVAEPIGKLNIFYPLGWAKNTSGHYKKQKKDLLEKLDDLDKKAELEQILRDEEMKIFQLKDGALKKHITAYYKFRIYPKTFIKEIYPSIVLILCRDAKIIQQNIMEGVVWIDFIMTGGHVGIKTHKGAKADGQVDGLVPHLKAANLNYFVSIFGCKKGGQSPSMFRFLIWKLNLPLKIKIFLITSSKEIGMGTKNVGFNVMLLVICGGCFTSVLRLVITGFLIMFFLEPELSLHYQNIMAIVKEQCLRLTLGGGGGGGGLQRGTTAAVA